MAEEHVTIFSNAMNEWEVATEQQSMNAFNNAISLMLLAIKKSPEPFARMYAFLSMAYYEAGICQAQQPGRNSEKQAKQLIDNAISYANSALEIEPLEFRAQLVKTYIASDKLLYLQGGVSNLIPRAGISAAGVLEFFGRAASTGVAAGKVGASQIKFKGEVKHLQEIYDQVFSEYFMDATEFCYFTEQLLNIADYCTNNKLAGAKEIFTSIVNVNPDDLKYDDLSDDGKVEVEQEVVKLRSLAEGRLMM
jgi:tetratricopeptide (TPR) repeat protein